MERNASTETSGGKQQDQVRQSSHSLARKLDIGQTVVARDYRAGNRWVPGVIMAQSGPLSYEVGVQYGDDMLIKSENLQ